MKIMKDLPEEIKEKIDKKIYFDKDDWIELCYKYYLPEDFIEKYKYKLNGSVISYWQKLSCSFIEKNFYYLDWYWISVRQKLTLEFIKKYGFRLFLDKIPLCYFNIDNRRIWKSFI